MNTNDFLTEMNFLLPQGGGGGHAVLAKSLIGPRKYVFHSTSVPNSMTLILSVHLPGLWCFH